MAKFVYARRIVSVSKYREISNEKVSSQIGTLQLLYRPPHLQAYAFSTLLWVQRLQATCSLSAAQTLPITPSKKPDHTSPLLLRQEQHEPSDASASAFRIPLSTTYFSIAISSRVQIRHERLHNGLLPPLFTINVLDVLRPMIYH